MQAPESTNDFPLVRYGRPNSRAAELGRLSTDPLPALEDSLFPEPTTLEELVCTDATEAVGLELRDDRVDDPERDGPNSSSACCCGVRCAKLRPCFAAGTGGRCATAVSLRPTVTRCTLAFRAGMCGAARRA